MKYEKRCWPFRVGLIKSLGAMALLLGCGRPVPKLSRRQDPEFAGPLAWTPRSDPGRDAGFWTLWVGGLWGRWSWPSSRRVTVDVSLHVRGRVAPLGGR